MGRAIQALGLLGMLAAVVYGIQTDDLGTEILGAVAGFALVLVGRSIEARTARPG